MIAAFTHQVSGEPGPAHQDPVFSQRDTNALAIASRLCRFRASNSNTTRAMSA